MLMLERKGVKCQWIRGKDEILGVISIYSVNVNI